MPGFRLRGMDLYDSRNSRLGKIHGNDIIDKGNSRVFSVKGDQIFDTHNSRIAEIKRDFLCDARGNKIIAIDDIRDVIDGDATSDPFLAAMWLAFCNSHSD